jgi:hypothetical protein
VQDSVGAAKQIGGISQYKMGAFPIRAKFPKWRDKFLGHEIR